LEHPRKRQWSGPLSNGSEAASATVDRLQILEPSLLRLRQRLASAKRHSLPQVRQATSGTPHQRKDYVSCFPPSGLRNDSLPGILQQHVFWTSRNVWNLVAFRTRRRRGHVGGHIAGCKDTDTLRAEWRLSPLYLCREDEPQVTLFASNSAISLS